MANWKTAQAPDFFFGMEWKARGQHGTKYLTGTIEADFLDAWSDDSSDMVATDRQELDWEDPKLGILLDWWQKKVQELLNEFIEVRGGNFENSVLSDERINSRIEKLDPSSQKQVLRFLKTLGQSETSQERALELWDSLVRAYEYRHFHDLVEKLEKVEDDPDQLELLLWCITDWKSLESRAVLEIVKWRLEVIDKFHKLIINNAPETAPQVGADNVHDLIAGYPWLLNPDWQTLEEEKTITKQLQKWNADDVSDPTDRSRYDFLCMDDKHRYLIIEIKRSGISLEIEEVQRLERYQNKLSKAHSDIGAILICGGNINVAPWIKKRFENSIDILTWWEVHERTRRHYEHYRAILEWDVHSSDFERKKTEVNLTRGILTRSVYRSKDDRAIGLGPQDVSYLSE